MNLKNLALTIPRFSLTPRNSEMRQHTTLLGRKWLTVIGLSVSSLFAATIGNAEGAPDCIHRAVAFDGIVPLSYATVTGAAGSKANIHAQYPAQCATSDESTCKGESSVVAGEAVAIGKTCGQWAYAQYIGNERIITGWIDEKRLAERAAKLPFDDGEPGMRARSPWWHAPSTIRVRLIRGKGVPVCEAYLQRLNQSVFHEPPYCGRPENDQVPGFERLERVPLAAAQVKSLYPTAFNLTNPTADNFQMRPPRPGASTALAEFWANGQLGYTVKAISGQDKISAWGFSPPLDIDNDGKPDNVVIWRDYPPIWNEGATEHCGEPTQRPYALSTGDSDPFILAPDGNGIDTQRTVAIFNTDEPRDPAYVRARKGIDLFLEYIPIGMGTTVFRYRGTTYFDVLKVRRGSGEPPNGQVEKTHVHVYLVRSGRRHDLCEYQNLDPMWWLL